MNLVDMKLVTTYANPNYHELITMSVNSATNWNHTASTHMHSTETQFPWWFCFKHVHNFSASLFTSNLKWYTCYKFISLLKPKNGMKWCTPIKNCMLTSKDTHLQNKHTPCGTGNKRTKNRLKGELNQRSVTDSIKRNEHLKNKPKKINDFALNFSSCLLKTDTWNLRKHDHEHYH